ncbi:hypothetical protein AB4Y77_09030 [Paenarthrobacter sp. YAF11_1]|uniref:hypothetical protein n=1 Tax=Paenarthrobacter sp. YAF11_1 TaxID=3233074 RepID=UPI003F964913
MTGVELDPPSPPFPKPSTSRQLSGRSPSRTLPTGHFDLAIGIGDNTLNFAQAKAITSGNPLVLERPSRTRNWPACPAWTGRTTGTW